MQYAPGDMAGTAKGSGVLWKRVHQEVSGCA